MADAQRTYQIFPEEQRWTHIALPPVKDLESSITWYEKHTHLKLLARNESDVARGAWLGDPTQTSSPFVLVLAQFLEGKDPFRGAKHTPLGPFAHIGIEVKEKSKVDEIAALAESEGCLALAPHFRPPPVGYVCFVRDPDGNVIEFSYDQGVYEKAKEVWGG